MTCEHEVIYQSEDTKNFCGINRRIFYVSHCCVFRHQLYLSLRSWSMSVRIYKSVYTFLSTTEVLYVYVSKDIVAFICHVFYIFVLFWDKCWFYYDLRLVLWNLFTQKYIAGHCVFLSIFTTCYSK